MGERGATRAGHEREVLKEGMGGEVSLARGSRICTDATSVKIRADARPSAIENLDHDRDRQIAITMARTICLEDHVSSTKTVL